MDGILQTPSQIASLLEAYFVKTGDSWVPSNRIIQPYMNRKLIRDLVRGFLDESFNIQVHAIGDNSVRSVVNPVEAYKSKIDYRLEIAYEELVYPLCEICGTGHNSYRVLPVGSACHVLGSRHPIWALRESNETYRTIGRFEKCGIESGIWK
jgi:hypothetical protein